MTGGKAVTDLAVCATGIDHLAMAEHSVLVACDEGDGTIEVWHVSTVP